MSPSWSCGPAGCGRPRGGGAGAGGPGGPADQPGQPPASVGSLLALIERAGWRLLAAVAVFLVLFIVRNTPMGPLLRLSPAAWLLLPGLALVAVAAFAATRVSA